MWFYSSLGLVLSCVILKGAFSAKDDFTRQVNVTYNPGCDIEECKGNNTLNLIYGRAQGPTDTLHYIVSTAGPSSPTVLLLRTAEVSAWLRIDWSVFASNSSKDLSGAVALVSNGGKIVNASIESVIIINSVLEYNDTTDTALYSASTQIQPDILLKQLKWKVETSGNTTQLLGKSDSERSFSPNSSVSIHFTPFGCQGQDNILPALPYNGNSSGWEINLASLLSNQSGSRFAVETLLLGVQSNNSKTSTKSIDDEYAPAAFTTDKIEWIRQVEENSVLTFHKWRAVGYTSPQHSRSTVTDVKSSPITSLNDTAKQLQGVHANRLLAAYFGKEKLESLRVNSVIFSFGQGDDGFYAASNYTSWSSTIGFGEPPEDHLSTLVLCMLFIGIGGPLLVIVFGGIYVAYVRMRRSGRTLKSNIMPATYDYQPIEK